jgi:hypothetical protein
MSIEDKKVKRDEQSTRSVLESKLLPRQLGVEQTYKNIGYKDAAGVMHYYTPEGASASFSSLELSGLAGSGTGNLSIDNDGKVVVASTGNQDISGKLDANTPITGATKTKITYDADGLVTAGADATTADIAASTDKNYVTDAEAVVIGNTSNTNTGDETYTNVEEVPVTIGGINAGDDFATPVSNSDMWTNLLYPYQVPSFSAFGFDGWVSSLEVGASTATSMDATWTIVNDDNVVANSIKVENITVPEVLVTGADIVSPEAVTGAAVTKTTSPASNVWKITGTNNATPTPADFTKTYTIGWYWKVMMGTDAATSINGATAYALSDYNAIRSSFAGTYTFSANNYKYLCWPVSMGTANSFKELIGGFAVPMQAPITTPVTNINGIEEDYYVYRTSFPQIAAISIIVS